MTALGRREGSEIAKVLSDSEDRLREDDIVFAPIIENSSGPIVLESGQALALNPMDEGADIIHVRLTTPKNCKRMPAGPSNRRR